MPNCDGCPKGVTVKFDHCKSTPDIVDVGSLVDFPRRHCGQNPISVPECIDAVESYTPSKVYVFRGTADEEYKFGAVENTVALISMMLAEPRTQLKSVAGAETIPNPGSRALIVHRTCPDSFSAAA